MLSIHSIQPNKQVATVEQLLHEITVTLCQVQKQNPACRQLVWAVIADLKADTSIKDHSDEQILVNARRWHEQIVVHRTLRRA